ncbi:Lrp/AsnC family transcriptional regulator [Halioglobus pacificus]|uniref:ArsR family transcriptional regulator n=1 Tax=Parahalioglobus pacificus TaxID=930806 RepID=A0A918XDV9_9GAMM|nr:Lrp/AsnC family transcriptional regulator [Halioglobus pacificus]GHD26751.1 ArsR family transcriptional regulator [Halioglobus pacificus]
MERNSIDKVDKILLRYLQADAALSIADLADLASISKSACWRRIQKLEEHGVILQRVTLLSQEALSVPLTAFISLKTSQHNTAWARKFKQVIEAIPGVLEVYRLGGDVDYLIKVVVPDMAGYDALYQQLLAADLFDVSASFVMEELKHTTQLPL